MDAEGSSSNSSMPCGTAYVGQKMEIAREIVRVENGSLQVTASDTLMEIHIVCGTICICYNET